MPVHLIEPTTSSKSDPGSGVWWKPSATRATFVVLEMRFSSISSGDSVDVDVDVRDPSSVVLAGYPVRLRYARGGLSTGNTEFRETHTFLVPPDHEIRYTDNSSGATKNVPSFPEVAV